VVSNFVYYPLEQTLFSEPSWYMLYMSSANMQS
jgi:hypothetical protein